MALGTGLAVGQPDVAELGGEDVLLPPPPECPPDQFLVGAVLPIGVGGVDEVHADLGGAMQRRDRLVGIGHAVDRRHAHAAECDRRYVEVSEFSASEHGGHRKCV
jgi:hypothetical protein